MKKNASNFNILNQFNVGFILNVAREVENPLLDATNTIWSLLSTTDGGSLYLKHHHIKSYRVISKKLFWDHHQDNIMESFASAFRFIDAARSQSNILIHCQCGVSRSATLVIAYLIYHLNMNFDHAYQYLKSRSSVIAPNLSLIAQLKEFQLQSLIIQ